VHHRQTVFAGLGFGAIFALGYKAFGSSRTPRRRSSARDTRAAKISNWKVGPELMGVGYIIGTRIALVMGAGGILSSLVLMPAIKLFGAEQRPHLSRHQADQGHEHHRRSGARIF